jgi:hypothetical protein
LFSFVSILVKQVTDSLGEANGICVMKVATCLRHSKPM